MKLKVAATRILYLSGMFCLTACASFMMKDAASEAIVLQDGTEVPCEILEIGDDIIIFEALHSRDRYTFGQEMPRGEVRAIRIFDGKAVSYVSVNEYLKIKGDEFSAPGEVVQTDIPEEQDVQRGVLDNEFKRIPRDNPPSDTAAPQRQAAPNYGSGLRLSDLVLPDSARSGSSTGLQVTSFDNLQFSAKAGGANLEELAQLVVASGAAGLILYRAEKLPSEGVNLTTSQADLAQAIKSSELWKTRSSGLTEAHRVASEAFEASFKRARYTLGETIGFRARDERRNNFAAFMLHLRMNGGLRAPAKKRFMQEWFGEIATTATIDLLANFDDWYYLFVIKTPQER